MERNANIDHVIFGEKPAEKKKNIDIIDIERISTDDKQHKQATTSNNQQSLRDWERPGIAPILSID